DWDRVSGQVWQFHHHRVWVSIDGRRHASRHRRYPDRTSIKVLDETSCLQSVVRDQVVAHLSVRRIHAVLKSDEVVVEQGRRLTRGSRVTNHGISDDTLWLAGASTIVEVVRLNATDSLAELASQVAVQIERAVLHKAPRNLNQLA